MRDFDESAPMKVRWETWSSTTDWLPCQWAEVKGDALVIDHGGTGQDMVPLHVIRGLIQVRRNTEATS